MENLLATTEDLLLKSHLFRSKPQMQRLLKYLLKHSYENNEQALQQKSIAIECLGRTSAFVSSKDPIVRIEAARLRKLLDDFYSEMSDTLPYRLSLPKGSYKVCFSRTTDNDLSAGFSLLLVCQSSQYAPESVLRLMTKVRHDLAIRLSKFQHLELMVEHLPKHHVAQRGSVHFLAEKQHDYVLRIEVIEGREQHQCLVSSVVIHRVSQEILWSDSTQMSATDNDDSLEVYYKHLLHSLVGEAFGLLGQHWSKCMRQQGLESLPSHQVSWVYLIGLVEKPSQKLAASYHSFLQVIWF